MDSLTFLLTELFVQRQIVISEETLQDKKEVCPSHVLV